MEVTRADRDTVIQINSNKSGNTAINLRITGETNDTFMIQNRIKIPGGKIDTSIRLDFYYTVFEFSYQHHKASSGKLLIHYDIP